LFFGAKSGLVIDMEP